MTAQNVDSMSWGGKFFLFRLFPTVLIFGGIAALYFGLEELRLAGESESWPTAKGTIEVSKVVRDDSDPNKSATYSWKIQYVFAVDAKAHTGSRVAYGDYSSQYPEHAQGIVDKYPVGKQVTVYHLPTDPQVCLLEPGVRNQVYFLSGFGLTLLVIGSLWFLFMQAVVARYGGIS